MGVFGVKIYRNVEASKRVSDLVFLPEHISCSLRTDSALPSAARQVLQDSVEVKVGKVEAFWVGQKLRESLQTCFAFAGSGRVQLSLNKNSLVKFLLKIKIVCTLMG